MKKITILAPLMLVPLLLACGNKPSDGSSVTEKEFNDAGRFKDVEYLQIDLEEIASGSTLNEEDTEHVKVETEIAPLINHTIEKNIYDGEVIGKTESYARVKTIKDESCEYIYKQNGDEEWQTKKDAKTEIYFCVPLDYSPLEILQIPEEQATDFYFEPEVSYKNFKHKDGKYIYNGEGVPTENADPETKMPVTLEFTFKNKKLIKSYFDFKISIFIEKKEYEIVKSETTMDFAYEKITPTWPIQPSK